MKGKRWELPQKFRTIYWQNFALTASIVMLTLALLGASFFALSYAYAADERSDEMAQKASVGWSRPTPRAAMCAICARWRALPRR